MIRGLVIGESLIDIVGRRRRACRRQSAQRRRRTRPAGPRRRLPDLHRRRRVRPAHHRVPQCRWGATCFRKSDRGAHRDCAVDHRRRRVGGLCVRPGLAAFRNAAGRTAAFRPHRIDCRRAGSGLPGGRGVGRHLSRLGHGHLRPERAAVADRRPGSGPRTHRASRRAQRHRESQRGGPALDRPRPFARADRADLAGAGSRDRGGDDG